MPIKLGRPRITPQQFSAKWADNELKESAASKEHFLDVCALVGSPTPREADKQGDWFAFEKGVAKSSGAWVADAQDPTLSSESTPYPTGRPWSS